MQFPRRALLLPALVPFALSCGSLHALGVGGPYDVGTSDTGTDQTHDTSTIDTGHRDTGHQDTGLVENCATPGDEDGNGLADCEDPACFDSSSCVEKDCSDGIDNDGDGWVDCDDDDCWGHGCAASIAAVSGGGQLFAERFAVAELLVCSGTTTGLYTGSYLAATNVSGTVYTVSASGGSDWRKCYFHVPQVYALATRPYGGATTYDAVSRPTVSVSGSCGVTTSGFLPQHLRLGLPNVYALDTSSFTPLWYQPGSYVSSTWSSFGTTYTSSGYCPVYWSSAAVGVLGSPIQFGSSYFFQVHH